MSHLSCLSQPSSVATQELQLSDLITQMNSLRDDALSLESRFASLINDCLPSQQLSARNLVHYLSVRQKDIRLLQQQLLSCGLSSLGMMEPNTLAHLNAVLRILQPNANASLAPAEPVDFVQGPALLAQRAQDLLGFRPPGRAAHIMVTMPPEAALEPELSKALLSAGMGLMRINCAHDTPSAWTAMVANVRQAEQSLGLGCRIQVDLAGPKVRTGSIEPRGHLLKLKPRRDAFGHPIAPLRVDIVPVSGHRASFSSSLSAPQLCVSDEFFAECQPGDSIILKDCRGKNRSIEIKEVQADRCVALTHKAIYITKQTCLCLSRSHLSVARCFPQQLPELNLPLLLCPGSHITLTRMDIPGRPGYFDEVGHEIAPARIHCTLDEAFTCAKVGHSVWFDDGKIGGEIIANDGDEIFVRITHARPLGSALWAEKGINFPDTLLTAKALTDKDLSDLKHVSDFADIVALSFVRKTADLLLLHRELNQLGKADTGIVLKIENREAFNNLPKLLLTGLSIGRPFGVMIARGDLAVEVGFERLSEIQQEIIWLCEAAHVPVIWATQILESMAKTGVPSRAEVSDAGMSVLTECAMLNKGPYIVETVQLLSGILSRMDQHYHKRRTTLRKLAVADIGIEPVLPLT